MRTVTSAVFLVLLTSSTILALPAENDAPTAYRLIDLTGDGQPDKLLLGVDGSLAVAVNRGNGVFEPVWQELPSIQVVDMLVTDLNGDSFMDIYLLAFGDNVALLGDGTGRLVDATATLGLADAHQGEYVPESEARLAWLTGFTGSAGLAVAMADRGALFIDGRYSLQARTQVDTSNFALHHITRMAPAKWLAVFSYPPPT